MVGFFIHMGLQTTKSMRVDIKIVLINVLQYLTYSNYMHYEFIYDYM